MKFILDFILRLPFPPMVCENNFGTEKLWYRKALKTASLSPLEVGQVYLPQYNVKYENLERNRLFLRTYRARDTHMFYCTLQVHLQVAWHTAFSPHSHQRIC